MAKKNKERKWETKKKFGGYQKPDEIKTSNFIKNYFLSHNNEAYPMAVHTALKHKIKKYNPKYHLASYRSMWQMFFYLKKLKLIKEIGERPASISTKGRVYTKAKPTKIFELIDDTSTAWDNPKGHYYTLMGWD